MNELYIQDKSQAISPDILRAKLLFGMNFGAIIGISFAISTWGMDGYILSQAHIYLPWLKLVTGMLACGLVGGVIGLLSIKFDRWSISILLWLGAGAFFAWLTVLLPLQFTSMVSEWAKPELKGLLTFSTMSELYPRFWISVTWILIFMFILGVLQTPLVEPAVFSISIFGKVMPFVLGIIIMVISGTMTDTFINSPLRDAALAMNKTVQFVVDQKGMDVDPAIARVNHAASLKTVKDQVTQSRSMVISGYDSTLGEIEFVILFKEISVKCSVLYSQPNICKTVQ